MAEAVNKKTVELSRKQKRLEKLKKQIFRDKDIKYVGPLSYRYLRIIAWLLG